MTSKQLLDLFITLFGVVAARLFALLSSIIIARVAGASTFGEYSIFVTIFVIASEVPNAIEATFIRFANTHNTKNSISIYQSAAVIIKVCYAIAIWITGSAISSLIAEHALNKTNITPLVHLSLLAASFMCIYNLIIGKHQQRKHFITVSFLRPIPGLIILLVLSYTAISGKITSEIISHIYIYTTIPLALASLIILFPTVKESFFESLNYIGPFIKIALFLTGSTLITIISNRLDIFFLTSFLEFESVGQYSAAIRISVIVALITAAASTIYLPKASEAVAHRKAFVNYIRLMITYATIQTLIAIAVIFNVEFIVREIFGNEFIGIESISTVLIIQVLFEAYSRGFQALIQCGPHPQYTFGISIFRLLVSTTLLMTIIPMHGALGGAIAVALTSGLTGLLLIYFALKDCTPPKEV